MFALFDQSALLSCQSFVRTVLQQSPLPITPSLRLLYLSPLQSQPRLLQRTIQVRLRRRLQVQDLQDGGYGVFGEEKVYVGICACLDELPLRFLFFRRLLAWCRAVRAVEYFKRFTGLGVDGTAINEGLEVLGGAPGWRGCVSG